MSLSLAGDRRASRDLVSRPIDFVTDLLHLEPRTDMSDLPFDAPQGPLTGERVVFSGKLWSLGRKDARAAVERAGGVCDDEVTQKTTMVVAGAESYPEGVPDLTSLPDDAGAPGQKLRRVAQLNLEHPGRIRALSEDEFCRLIGLPAIADLRTQHYGQKDVLAMYPLLREDHLRYLQKWGVIKAAFRNHADTWFGFSDLTTLRHVHARLQEGVPFRVIVKEQEASRSGQLAFDFRLDAHQARILALRPPRDGPASEAAPPAARLPITEAAKALTVPAEPKAGLSTAEQYFLIGSLLDDGSAERLEEAAQAYRRALADDPDMVAALINLANIRYARDELAEAQALYERAIGLDPTYFEAHFNLGNIHHDHARYLDAEACYREALGLNPAYADTHFYLAVTLEKMGRSAEARVHWRAYQNLAPTGEWVELAREFSD
jgi:tetratricopeptide (TPR) repeat protein